LKALIGQARGSTKALHLETEYPAGKVPVAEKLTSERFYSCVLYQENAGKFTRKTDKKTTCLK